MELRERDRQLRAEYRRELDEQFKRKKQTGFKNGAEALEALSDLFESSVECTRVVVTNDISVVFATAGELWTWGLTRGWGGARPGGLELWLDKITILSPA